ncbi:hypothetical protein CI105_03285 [Candidatus Izimaplasma bacterium ZiA1]|uniref:DNA glycosylase AlkZ-like family protein n=1 Tax=Candidatus Izimoplasma sp. ZiA1 TaxID=2024899 RepID=UPI000BAA73F4|nr:hypothetical protein CI105_03285 [Candidatus Izimaplasma bacterium ZiA1]
MDIKTYTKKEVRDLMVSYHMININSFFDGKTGVIEVFDKLKSIQYDPLNCVSRNSDLVLQARVNNYKENHLYELLYVDKLLIDGWDKQMSIYKASDFPNFIRIRQARTIGAKNTLNYRGVSEALEHQDFILDEIKTKGPLYSKDFNIKKAQKDRWGSSKISSHTLDYLFHSGKLGINNKNGVLKQFDLMENIVGELIEQPPTYKNDDEFIKWYLLRRIKSLGVFQNKSSVAFCGPLIDSKKTRDRYFQELEEKNQIMKFYIEDDNKEYYMYKGVLDNNAKIIDKVSFLAPLDNLLWDRDLVSKIFNFDYRWEVYTPKIKRKYGYYVLPVISGSRIIGRIEFENYQTNNELKIIGFWWEENIDDKDKQIQLISIALETFKEYLNAKKVTGKKLIRGE